MKLTYRIGNNEDVEVLQLTGVSGICHCSYNTLIITFNNGSETQYIEDVTNFYVLL